MIIGVRLMGGLCNQLFQAAFGESMAKKFGCDLVYTNLYNNQQYNLEAHYARAPHVEEYLRVFPRIGWTKNQERLGELKRVQHIPFHFVDVTPRDGTEYVGYFQSYKYWESFGFIRWLLSLEQYLADTDSCFIHVRRTDYLKLPDFHTVLGMDYYQGAIEYMERYEIKKYYVFSDDPQWCKENFIGDSFEFLHGRDYVDFRHMVHMSYGIISNSTFSLLPALLIPDPHKVIVSPKKESWFGPRCTDSPRDLIPESFVQI